MGLFSAIGSFISGAVSVIGSAIGTVGGALGNVATVATKMLGLALPHIRLVVEAISLVGKLLGVLKEKDNPEELGAKAMSTDKKPEDFDTFNDYIDFLRNDVEIDKEKLKNSDKGTKLANTVVGASITARGIEEKLKSNIPLSFWKDVALQELKSQEIVKTIEKYRENNVSLDKYSDFVDGKLDFKERLENKNILVETYKELEPQLSSEEIETKVFQMEKK